MLFAAMEVAMVVLFCLVLADAVRNYDRNRKKLLLLVLAFIYAIIFENFNMFLSQGHLGSYFYNQGFTLWIWKTPLSIALAWAVLIYTAMHLSDMLKLKTLTRPFMDALLIVLIDLTLDVVAVRQHIWYWVGHSQAQG
ncbi:MAG: carotenoid biosynthesis protein, partial [Nanoarchaeota archaeon]|nr:carotenoid biosynthesis protein [Nanoarchaeota archaeon]